jgi:addiction module HigA family antidote
MKKLKNIHPGEILLEEFLKPLFISQYQLAMDLGIPQSRVSQIIKGNRRITADTALRIAQYFGNSAKFWLGLQDDFDLEEEKAAMEYLLKSIPKAQTNAAQQAKSKLLELILNMIKLTHLKFNSNGHSTN